MRVRASIYEFGGRHNLIHSSDDGDNDNGYDHDGDSVVAADVGDDVAHDGGDGDGDDDNDNCGSIMDGFGDDMGVMMVGIIY